MASARETITLDEARELALSALTRHGCDAPNAEAVAGVMLAAEADRAESHGLFRLPGYVASLKSGKVDGGARPSVTRLAPGVVRVDGRGGFAPLAIEMGRAPLIEATREQGIAALALVDIHHFAALWPEVEALAEAGLVALACTCATPMVAPAGGTKPFFGTNPLAFAFPRRDAPPVVFDQASAAMARGDVSIHAREGKPVPPGTGLGPDGQPTIDPAEVLKGAQLPFGGYKGSNIALMIELLAGALIGEVFSYEAGQRGPKDGGPPVGGELILALDPDRFGAGAWRDRVENLLAEMLAQPGVRLPGARRHRNRRETGRTGIDVPSALLAEIRALAGGE
ncbi:Ldh family oxidoreductase [Limibaculum sp. FT325]|uniref:Ldh family oxidoreductase n=1 Tax=Thermohalobaculum sediminis TaxID=2939436 RepID=UPI0020BD835F|nr:Ldh family oxidoreductase [Limibaculum sediminis]MCL5777461.1 Ldh family oxidoreductase [Limibaculum sediminis]